MTPRGPLKVYVPEPITTVKDNKYSAKEKKRKKKKT